MKYVRMWVAKFVLNIFLWFTTVQNWEHFFQQTTANSIEIYLQKGVIRFYVKKCQNAIAVDRFSFDASQQPGVNFTNILWAAFAPVELHLTYWRKLQSIKHKSLALLLVVCTGKVGQSFVGDTDCAKLSVLAHLRFLPVGWWNWPQQKSNGILLSEKGCMMSKCIRSLSTSLLTSL